MLGPTHVDVIIPTYNGLPYLREAVESVLGQTHLDLTLYVVDDGSTDSTEQYIQSLHDRRVRYIKRENQGQANARNEGIGRSRAPFVAFLDADDFWYPEKIAEQLRIISSDPEVGLVYGYQRNIDAGGRIIGQQEARLRGWVFEDLLGGNFITGSCSMVLLRREALARVGSFKKDFLIGEDWELWMRVAREYKLDYVPRYLAAVRIHDAGYQQNSVKMAQALTYIYPRIVEEFNLNTEQRRRLARYCLLWAARDYYLVGSPRSVPTLLRLIHGDRRMLLQIKQWFIYFRILLGRPRVLLLKRLLLGRNEKRVEAGAWEIECGHEQYLAGNRSESRRIFWQVLRSQPRFTLYFTKWELYFKLLVGRKLVLRLKSMVKGGG